MGSDLGGQESPSRRRVQIKMEGVVRVSLGAFGHPFLGPIGAYAVGRYTDARIGTM